MRVLMIIYCLLIPNFQAYLFRRQRPDLIKNHLEGPSGFRVLLSGLIEAGKCDIAGDEIRFYNGSKIYLCHCKDEKDRFKYQGAEIHFLGIDELTHFTDTIYRFLRSRVRPVGLKITDEIRAALNAHGLVVPPRILCSANPGGVGHGWVKATFIDAAPAEQIYRAPKQEGGMLRQYIPARVNDNPTLLNDDPEYVDRLKGLGSKELVKAMLEGDWNVAIGAFFQEFKHDRHVLKPFKIPKHWHRYRSFDWGSAKPFAVHWWAVSDGTAVQTTDGRNILLPRGCLVGYREWYGMQVGRPNVGLGDAFNNISLAKGIVDRSYDEDLGLTVTDSLPFQYRGGLLMSETFYKNGVKLKLGDTSRIAGAQQVRQRLQGTERGPMLVFFDNCTHAIRTIPALPTDEKNFEDIDTNAEDHAYDSVRLACMERPIVNELKQPKRPGEYTFDDLLEHNRIYTD